MKEIISFIRGNDGFLIATHINPEGDALGSAIALSMGLEAIGKSSIVYERDPIPDFYRFLPGCERVTDFLPDTESFSLILVDCNTPDRAALEGHTFRHTAVIDHHETDREFGDIKWVEPGAPAAGLMVYRLLKEMGIKITGDMAVNLYTAIAVDTGTFRFSNTGPEALRAGAELIEAGAEPALISEALHESWSLARFKLLCMTLGDLEIKDGVALAVITKDMLGAAGALPEDTENFSNFPRMVKDIKVSVFFRETEEGWKASLRSKRRINVARIAERFGGGGHRNAAGFTIKADLQTAKRMLLEEIKDALT